MEDERRILKSLRDIKDLLNHFNPSLTTKFSIKSLLTLVAKNTFSEMRSGATGVPLQLEFDYRLSRAIKQRSRGNVLHHLLTSQLPSPGFHHHILQ